jgi:hypothetical protein
VKKLKWCELWRSASGDGRRFYICKKKQSERLKRPERQRRFRGKMRRQLQQQRKRDR